MAVTYGQVSCSAAATQVVAAAIVNSHLDDAEVRKIKPRLVTLLNSSATAVFIGDASVTSATGYQLAQNQSVQVDLGALDSLYGRTASSTATVHYITSM